MIKVKALQDSAGHWYIVPNELSKDFHRDLQNDDLVATGEFDQKYGGYRTGGDINLVQLYVENNRGRSEAAKRFFY